MCPQPQYSRLCYLLDEYLHPFSDLAADSLTEENEKGLLIALSLVFRQVKQWSHESESDEELSESFDDREHSVAAASNLDNHYCLAKIIGDLMFLLSVNSQYAQHLAGNTLVAIAEIVLTSDNGWDYFMNLLCLCLELAICNCLTFTSDPGPLETRYLDFEFCTSKSLLKPKLKSANWFVVADIFRLLRNILKNLKQDSDEKIMKVYLDSVSSLMLNLPWDILTEIYVGHNTKALKGSAKDVLLHSKIIRPKEITVFFGSFVQFFCSLVSQSNFREDGAGYLPVICKIINLVPKLTAWCHAELRSPHATRNSHYFRHKVLMLMVKLSSRINIEQTILMMWVQLLHKYFEDLLLQPMSGDKSDRDGSLEGSPFHTSIYDPGEQSMLSSHLQRLSVFLFLKCALNLICTKGSPGEKQCTYENPNHYLTMDLNLTSECSSNSVGIVELHKWLKAHVPADMIVNNELYVERCMRFTLSFLQLFMHEDDILFDMLLQLLRVPFCPEHWVVKDELLTEVKNCIVFLASDLFNPVHLFHLFLAEIHYDHQVLLDYLISKDSGSSCAEYLLRSLRIVCNSLSLFVEFPGMEESSNQICSKRQKVEAEFMDFKGVFSPASLNDGGISSLEECNEGEKHGRKYCRNSRLPFVDARDCLFSLMTSINSLNQKNLFPYNPQVLLQRLMRFQELCDK